MAFRVVLVFLTLWVPQSQAAEFRLPVEDPAVFSVEIALDRAVQQAAEQMTGVPVNKLTSDAPDLFSLSEAFVNSYGFESDAFVVDVDLEGLQARLESAGVAIWQGPRPQILLWATEERGLERVMIGNEPHPAVDPILASGPRFNIEITRPLMDLEDTLALAPAEIWGEFDGAVEAASSRYGAEYIVVIGERPARQTMHYWMYSPEGSPVSGQVSGGTVSERSDALIETLMAFARSQSESITSEPVFETPVDVPAQAPSAASNVGFSLVVRYEDIVNFMALLDHLAESSAPLQVTQFSISGQEALVQIKTDLPLEAIDRQISSFEGARFISPLVYALN